MLLNGLIINVIPFFINSIVHQVFFVPLLVIHTFKKKNQLGQTQNLFVAFKSNFGRKINSLFFTIDHLVGISCI